MAIVYVEKLLAFIAASQFSSTRHVEFYLIWVSRLLIHQGTNLKSRSNQISNILTNLQQVLSKKQQEIGKM